MTNTATAAVVTGQKRSAPPVENVDADELERRKKRAERFVSCPTPAFLVIPSFTYLCSSPHRERRCEVAVVLYHN